MHSTIQLIIRINNKSLGTLINTEHLMKTYRCVSMNLKTGCLIYLMLLFSINVFSQESSEKRAESLLKQMTLKEKIDFIGGTKGIHILGYDRLKIPEMIMSDGPLGVNNDHPSTAYPAGLMLAATWNTELAAKFGTQIGSDLRARGIHIWLGPGVNIYRSPLSGRNFEYFGEDPYLASSMVVPIIENVQKKGIIATVKHYAANNSEYNRRECNSVVDERTLQEIYFPAFHAAVCKAKVGAVMTAFNLINGDHCSESDYLLNKTLKKDWGFQGFVMSDWTGTYNGVKAANAGLDLEMPSGVHMQADTLIEAIKAGKVKEEVINDKVRRILNTCIKKGFYDRNQQIRSIPLDDPESNKASLNEAREGIILLKNKDNVLPLNRNEIKSIAVIGPDSHPAVWGGGGSPLVTPFHTISFFDGIKSIAGNDITVKQEYGISAWFQKLYAESTYSNSDENGKITEGLKAEYFENMNLSGKPKVTRIEKSINISQHVGGPFEGFVLDQYSVRWTGNIIPKADGKYALVAGANDGVRVWLDNQLIIDDWANHAVRTHAIYKDLKAGRSYSLKIEYYQWLDLAETHFGWGLYSNEINEAAVKLAKAADVAVVCVGFDKTTEQEASDRTFALSDDQVELINEVSNVNKNTIVVLTAGGSVDAMKWIDKVPAFIHTIYSGQNGGLALAEILFGTINPSGHLPFTYEKRWEDNPCFPYYHTSNENESKYTEGIFVGYRGFEKNKIEPLFPFGYGLSYTTFEYSNLKIEKKANAVILNFSVKNTGKREGKEVTQVYVSDKHCSVERPLKELKGFKKVSLKPGESKNISIELKKDAFAFYDIVSKNWKVEPGEFEILVGASSSDIKLRGKMIVSESGTWL